VRTNGDSLNCKIEKIKSDFIYLTFRFEDEVRSTLLNRKDVYYFEKDFYKTALVSKQEIKDAKVTYEKFSISSGVGTSTLLSSSGPNGLNFYKNASKGANFRCNVNYHFSEIVGIGLLYSRFRSTHEGIAPNLNPLNQQLGLFFTRYDIDINYFGFIGSSRFNLINKKVFINSDISMGYVNYQNNVTIANDFLRYKGQTLGLGFDLGIEAKLYKNLSLGYTFSSISAQLKSVEISNGVEKTVNKTPTTFFKNLNRIDHVFFLKFRI
jgi:hypothetical protein